MLIYENEDLIKELCELINKKNIDYFDFKFNPTEKIFNNNFNVDNNRDVLLIRNFPLKSQDELYLYTRCIINDKLLIRPARTETCRHIECMELEILFKFILEYSHCPLCKELDKSFKQIGVDSIYIDIFIESVISKSIYNTNEFGKTYELVILDKYKKLWRPYFNNLTCDELDDIYCKVPSAKKSWKLFKDNPRSSELIDMNYYIGQSVIDIPDFIQTLVPND